MDLAQILVNLSDGLTAPLWRLLWVLGGVVGLFVFGRTLLKMLKASRFPGQHALTIGDVVLMALVATLMVNMSSFINATWNSLGSGTTTYGPISYSGAAPFGRLAPAINAVLTLASISGGYFFFRGLLLLKKAAVGGESSQGGDDAVWRAITHLIGGACLVQISDVIDRFRQTAGLAW
jgi:hypothetical protein